MWKEKLHNIYWPLLIDKYRNYATLFARQLYSRPQYWDSLFESPAARSLLKPYCQMYWAPILIIRRSWTLIFIIWVFSHSSVDYTVTYSIKTKGWWIRYIDLQLEPNIYFSEFTSRSITSNLNNGCRWPRRVEEEAMEGDKRVGWSKYDQQLLCPTASVWSNNGADRICRTVEMGWSAQNIYSQIVTASERMCLVGSTQSLLQNRAAPHHSESMLINNVWWIIVKSVLMGCTQKKERKGGGQTKRNAFFSLWQWQVHSLQSTVAVSVSRGEGWGRRGGIFKWPALFGRPSPQGNYCGEPFFTVVITGQCCCIKD